MEFIAPIFPPVSGRAVQQHHSGLPLRFQPHWRHQIRVLRRSVGRDLERLRQRHAIQGRGRNAKSISVGSIPIRAVKQRSWNRGPSSRPGRRARHRRFLGWRCAQSAWAGGPDGGSDRFPRSIRWNLQRRGSVRAFLRSVSFSAVTHNSFRFLFSKRVFLLN